MHWKFLWPFHLFVFVQGHFFWHKIGWVSSPPSYGLQRLIGYDDLMVSAFPPSCWISKDVMRCFNPFSPMRSLRPLEKGWGSLKQMEVPWLPWFRWGGLPAVWTKEQNTEKHCLFMDFRRSHWETGSISIIYSVQFYSNESEASNLQISLAKSGVISGKPSNVPGAFKRPSLLGRFGPTRRSPRRSWRELLGKSYALCVSPFRWMDAQQVSGGSVGKILCPCLVHRVQEVFRDLIGPWMVGTWKSVNWF